MPGAEAEVDFGDVTIRLAGYRVRYTLATKLVNELVEAADEKVLTKTIARYGRVDLLCIDELGYMELDRRGAELLFQVLTEREEKNSVAIASNGSFSGWTKTFTDPRLCAAIVDRLTFGGNLIQTGTDSYRLAITHARAAAHDASGCRRTTKPSVGGCRICRLRSPPRGRRLILPVMTSAASVRMTGWPRMNLAPLISSSWNRSSKLAR